MSGTDYTKKAENGNTDPWETKGREAKISPRSAKRRLSVWWYELVFLYKSRAEKLFLALAFLILAFSWVGLAYLAQVFEVPAPIVACQPG